MGKAAAREKLLAAYNAHAKHYEDILAVAQQGGLLNLDLIRDDKTRMVIGGALVVSHSLSCMIALVETA